MTPEELAEIEERCRKATPGPWVCIYRGHDELDGQKYAHDETPLLVMSPDCESHPVADASCNHTCRMPEDTEANARFIAHARADVPALVAEVRRLREELDREDEDAERDRAYLVAACEKVAGHKAYCSASIADEAVAEADRLRAEVARLNRTSLPHMCRDGHEMIRHAGGGELCPVCEAHENLTRLADYALCGTGGVEDVGHSPESHLPPTGLVPRTAYDAIGKWRAEVVNLRAEVARLREALDAAQRIVKRKAEREAGREET